MRCNATNCLLLLIHPKSISLQLIKNILFYGHLSLNTKEAKEEDEIFKSDWSQRGLRASSNNQTTKYTSVQDCLYKTYTH